MEKLLFPTLQGKWRNIELNKYAKVLQEDAEGNPFLDPDLFGEWINLLHKTIGVDYSWGGYMEDREEILDGIYLPAGCKIHLGVDYWVPQDVAVYLPKAGKLVYARFDPDQNGGWGGQMIFDINGLYYIFGHLKEIAIKVGEIYPAGSRIGYIAEIECNGGWYPHLHVQCMKRLGAGFVVDVDGYAAPRHGLVSDFPNPMEAIMSTMDNKQIESTIL